MIYEVVTTSGLRWEVESSVPIRTLLAGSPGAKSSIPARTRRSSEGWPWELATAHIIAWMPVGGDEDGGVD